jgi:hypothetical protein
LKNLREYSWKISYTSNTHNTITDFYIPALECAIQYDRKARLADHARRKTPQDRKKTPNRLLQLILTCRLI